MKDEELEVQINESYTRDVYIKIRVPKERKIEFNEILDEFDGMDKNYEEIIERLDEAGFEIFYIDDNDSLFEFADNNYIDLHGVRE